MAVSVVKAKISEAIDDHDRLIKLIDPTLVEAYKALAIADFADAIREMTSKISDYHGGIRVITK
jgi:hypothetical protein